MRGRLGGVNLVAALTLAVAAAHAADRVAAYGHVSAGDRTITVAAPYCQGAPPIVAELFVKEGDQVAKGQKLATTQSGLLATTDLAAAKAHLTTAEARLRGATAGPKPEDLAAQQETVNALAADTRAEKARKLPDAAGAKNEALAREEAAAARGAAAQHQLAALREPRPADLAVAKAETEEARAGVTHAEALLNATAIMAPSDGQVFKILAAPGESAAAGVIELGDTRAMTIKAELNPADLARVRVGAKATITSAAWTGSLTGSVARIRPRVERNSLGALSTFANVDRQTIEATIQPDAPEKLAGLAGLEVTVEIAGAP